MEDLKIKIPVEVVFNKDEFENQLREVVRKVLKEETALLGVTSITINCPEVKINNPTDFMKQIDKLIQAEG